ncbi:prepilin-type N-terminal cleavage/methylation domain-containing protein [Granulibacter bethesdensis]|uniref:prepilin-type N-terminal cleavage/methylation domain-containing protein n=1 Tax=Granulibacter bethesdensis TaxID=364410 RepID=UPI0003F20040|nr:prepilin-type N-terminal cleavage/methylation domain-containing protein [Granulibacter bethesdensis]AHJ68398.1 General secretion pathway protein J [Granulibacter bethesdensis]
MMRSGDRRQEDAGFTLLEVLVALVVLGFLIVGLTEGTRFGFLAQQHQDAMQAGAPALEGADRALRSLLRTMRPGLPTDDSNPLPWPHGDNRMLFFIALMPGSEDDPSSPDSTLADMVLLVRDNALTLRWTRHINGTPRHPLHWQEATLLAPVQALAIAYQDDQGHWSGRWEGPAIPSLIRLSLRRSLTQKEQVLIIAPRIDTERP